VETPEKRGSCGGEVPCKAQVPEAMEERVNNDNIGIQTINSWRKNQVEPQPMGPAIPRTAERIQKKPGDKLQEMGAGDGRNFAPEDRSGLLRERDPRLSKREALNALGVEMNFAMVLAGETLEQFGERALGTMAAVNER